MLNLSETDKLLTYLSRYKYKITLLGVRVHIHFLLLYHFSIATDHFSRYGFDRQVTIKKASYCYSN